jgi:hypothetical protein
MVCVSTIEISTLEIFYKKNEKKLDKHSKKVVSLHYQKLTIKKFYYYEHIIKCYAN